MSEETNRLAMYIICCHVDKPMEEGDLKSKYNIPLQAGAALTDKRICDLNDYDGFDDSISARNKRYSEMTAMYWIGKHINTEYVGIGHYRRRFLLSDSELDKYMDKGFDIITTKSYPLPEIVTENYRVTYYSKDWDLFMEILEKYAPDDMDLAHEVFAKDHIHPCNMNIFNADTYREYWEYVFPVLDEFYKRSPWKKDVYQRRDVGFIGERLSSLFVEKKIREGARVYEAPFRDLRSKTWSPEDECDPGDFDAVYKACEKFYLADDITKCRLMVAEAIKNGGINDNRMRTLLYLFRAAVKEQSLYTETFLEYLPQQWKKDLNTLVSAFEGVGVLAKILSGGVNPEAKAMYDEFMNATGFSEAVFKMQCEMSGVSEVTYELVNNINPVLVIVPDDICYGTLKEMAIRIGESLGRKGEYVYYSNNPGFNTLVSKVGNNWKMIIGVQTSSLNSEYFAGMNSIPKIQIIMDSSYFVPDLFVHASEDYHYFFHDENYAIFAENQYGLKNVNLFVPGFEFGEEAVYKKKYDFSFIGTYKKPADTEGRWEDKESYDLYDYIIKNPKLCYEKAVRCYYESKGRNDLTDNQIKDLLWNKRDVLFVACDYWRDRVIRTLLLDDIRLDVFGESWKNYEGKGQNNLIIHNELKPEEAIVAMKKSRLSLNIMSWHKAGLTERVINIMGSGAVAVSDETTRIRELFNTENDADQEIALFNLDDIDKLPALVKSLLQDEEKQKMISSNAKNRIVNEFTWDRMTDEMIKNVANG